MKTPGPRLPRTRRWDDREGMAMTVSPLHILNLSSLGSISFVLEVGGDQAIPNSSTMTLTMATAPYSMMEMTAGIGSVAPGAGGDEPDLMATLAGSSRRVRPQYVNYTKEAKRVDVRKLKENIWKNLDIKVPTSKDPGRIHGAYF